MDYTTVEDVKDLGSRRLLSELANTRRQLRRARSIITVLQWDHYGACMMGCSGNRATGHFPGCSIGDWLEHNSIIPTNGDSVS